MRARERNANVSEREREISKGRNARWKKLPNFNLGSPHLEMSSCQNAKTGLFLEVSTVEQLKRVFKSGARNTPKYVTTERSPQISTSFLPLLHFLISPSVRLSSCVIIVFTDVLVASCNISHLIFSCVCFCSATERHAVSSKHVTELKIMCQCV